MLRRKIYRTLLDWKNQEKKECLLIKGARQVGKTYIVEQFATEHYKHFFELNFIFHPELMSVFEGSLEVDDLLQRMSAHFPGAEFVPGETLIFLDEIQKCPNARTAMKAFSVDGRFDVIASGSLLGLHYGQDPDLDEEISSIPVGYERHIVMHSLDFEEFLWAMGIEPDIILRLKGYFERREKVPEDLNTLFSDYVRQYIVVGGMPAVVACFCDTKNYSKVHEVQQAILDAYSDDILRHAKGAEKQKVRKCFLSVPAQLAKENKKFQYSGIEPRGTERKFGASLQWLSDACFVNVCTNTTGPFFPLSAYLQGNYFKIYIHDTGLLVAMYGFEMKRVILDRSLSGPMKGGIYENLIADLLVKAGHSLVYFKPEENNQEIEFLISRNAEILPVEVKSKRGETISLNRYIEKYRPPVAYKLIDGNVGMAGCKVTLPHYMVMFL